MAQFLSKKQTAKVAGVVVVVLVWVTLLGLVFEGVKKVKPAKKGGIEFKNIDPLIGWGHDSIVSLKGCESNPVKIVITGGSASDIIVFKKNWILGLHQLLMRSNVCHEIVILATAGHSSGQELLRIIRDDAKLSEHQGEVIHISYSGANEHLNPKYVSSHEMSLFQNNIGDVLPQHFHQPAQFWHRNIAMMDALSKAGKYRFVAILQPVNWQHGGEDVVNYEKHYPEMVALMEQSNIEFFDFSHLLPSKMFSDDCHLTEAGDKQIAGAVYEIILGSKATAECVPR